jgi:hypothetical protein
MFKDFCHQVEMKVAILQSNGVVERANTLIFKAIKKILEGETKDKWAKVMLRAVWSHNKMVSRATKFTPFRLLFRAKVVLPKEIKHQSLRIAAKASSCPNKVEEKDLLESD